MIVANHQPQFLPYLGFFDKLSRADMLVVLDDVQFQERGFQHRNVIKMQTGKQWLTVPIKQRRGQLIKEVQIDSESNWRKKHWAALVTNYSPAPFFAELSPGLRDIILNGEQRDLVTLDLDLMRWTMSVLGLSAKLKLSSELEVAGDANERHIAICKAVGADTYLSGPGGKLYMDLAMYESAGVSVQFQDYAHPTYRQLFPKLEFIPNLAVIDALFNLGPATRELLGRPQA
ncbi:MAG TPA: WbqC family protein [Kofleriaceae bacterium]|nr:WbqC family protein [Kofleriaceae bacterium]